MKKVLQQLNISQAEVLLFDTLSDLVLDNRAATRLPKNANAVIVALFPYYVGKQSERNICRYATLPDYHKVVGDILTKAAEQMLLDGTIKGEYAAFADNSPFCEVELGIRAGLGFRGRNNLLINAEHGSFHFIGELVVTLTQIPSSLVLPTPQVSGCGSCILCENACLAGCISKGRSPDYSSCVSAISQRKGELSEKEMALMSAAGYAWGCDLCQECCPYNSKPSLTPIAEFSRDVVSVVDDENLTRLLETRAFSWRGKAVMERNLKIISIGHEY